MIERRIHAAMQAGGGHVVHCEALEGMDRLPADSIDAVVMDPPYCSGAIGEAQRTAAKSQGISSRSERRFGWFQGDNMGTAGLMFLLRSIAYRAATAVKPSGSLVVFADWRMVPTLAPAIESAGLRFQNLVIWDKLHPGMGQGFRAQHEVILHFTNGQPAYYCRSAGNVLRVARVRHDRRRHQTEKPVELLRKLIEVVAPPEGLVLDPFGGSGSTIVAALEAGRHGLAFERDANFCTVAAERISNARRTP